MLNGERLHELMRGLRVKKVRMPDFFTMSLRSDYARAAAQVFFSGGDPAVLTALAKARADSADAVSANDEPSDVVAAAQFSFEEIQFHTPDGDVAVTVDVAKNNQLLGACRQIELFRWGYEPEIHCATDLLTPPDAVLYDVGANWAPISLQLALRRNFCGRIYTFEPQRQPYENCREFVSRLNLEDRVFPHPFGISDRQSEAHLSVESWTGNVHVAADGGGEACTLMPLDDLSLPPPHLIKIDVEGHEAQVISGASRLLRESRPRIIFEDWISSPKTVYDQLGGVGYSFYYPCWYSPFLDMLSEAPVFLGNIQVLALLPFTASDRGALPERINVLSSIDDFGDSFESM